MLGRFLKPWIKRRLYNTFLKQDRKVIISTLDNAKRVGIIWNPVDSDGLNSYSELLMMLSDRNIEASGITYAHTKHERQALSAVSSTTIINRCDVSWRGVPKTAEANAFLQEKFDILIDLSISKSDVLQYILVHSESAYKIGWRGTEPMYYDLEIDVSSRPESSFLMHQIIHYLYKLSENR